MSIETRVAFDKPHLRSLALCAVPYAQIFTAAEQCSPAQSISCESCCVDFWINAAAEKEQYSGIFAVDYTRLGIDLLPEQYSSPRVKEAHLPDKSNKLPVYLGKTQCSQIL